LCWCDAYAKSAKAVMDLPRWVNMLATVSCLT